MKGEPIQPAPKPLGRVKPPKTGPKPPQGLEARKSPLARKSGVRKKRPGPPRRGRVPKLAYRDWIRGQGCQVHGLWHCRGVDAHHVRTWGATGIDEGNLIGLCRALHQQLHDMGRHSFNREYRIDCAQRAADLWDQYCQETRQS